MARPQEGSRAAARVPATKHGVALVTARATRGRRTLTYRVAEIVHFRDGKVTERWAFSHGTERVLRFFADPPD